MPAKHATLILLFIILGVIAGLLSGWYLGPAMLSVEWIGELFMRSLKMLIVPLLVAAVITGVASLGDVRKLGRVGWSTLGYYITTTGVAVGIGLLMVNLIQPGEGIASSVVETASAGEIRETAGLTDLALSLISPNIVQSAATGQMLPLITFSILFAAALTTLGRAGDSVLRFFEGWNEAMMKLVTWLMYLAPLGIFALIAARMGKAGGGEAFFQEISAVGLHVVTVLSGLLVHVLVLVAILLVFTRQRIGYLIKVFRALMTAFGTASSSATLPVTMECVHEAGVDERAVRFVLPLGSTVNMNGTALYEAAAAMFIAQAYGVDMGFTEQVVIFLTATLAAVGAAGIPEAGLVTMVIVLESVGLPLEGLGLLVGVDWFLDRFRTSVNVLGDIVGAAYVEGHLPD